MIWMNVKPTNISKLKMMQACLACGLYRVLFPLRHDDVKTNNRRNRGNRHKHVYDTKENRASKQTMPIRRPHLVFVVEAAQPQAAQRGEALDARADETHLAALRQAHKAGFDVGQQVMKAQLLQGGQAGNRVDEGCVRQINCGHDIEGYEVGEGQRREGEEGFHGRRTRGHDAQVQCAGPAGIVLREGSAWSEAQAVDDQPPQRLARPERQQRARVDNEVNTRLSAWRKIYIVNAEKQEMLYAHKYVLRERGQYERIGENILVLLVNILDND